MFAGVSTGPCVASIPAAMVGADTTGGAVMGGATCGGGTDPDCIAVIAPSDSECAPAAAGCPVTIPVANDWPTDVGDTPCPRAAGDSDPPGIAGATGGPVPMTGGVAAGGDVTGGAVGTGPALACHPPPNATPDLVALTPLASPSALPTPPCHPVPETADNGGAWMAPLAPPAPPPALRHPPPSAESRSFSLTRRGGGGASSTLKPLACAHVRGSSPISSASRISCVAVMTLSTASRDAFAASALHLAWIAWISATCSGSGFFDARTSSISLFPSPAMSVNRLRK